MALVKKVLVDGFASIFDEESSLFSGFPSSLQVASTKWSQVIFDYGSKVTPPSWTANVAKVFFEQEFMNIPNIDDIQGISLAIKKFADSLAQGMSPTFKGTAPPVPVNLSAVANLGLNGASSKDCIDLMSTLIDAWFRTGTAQNIVSGIIVPWS